MLRMFCQFSGKDALPANEEKEYLLEPMHSTIKLSLVNEVLREKNKVIEEKTTVGLWLG
jgi:hypothetical protein